MTESCVKRPRGLRQQGCPDPVISPLSRYPRPFHFPSLRCLLRFVSFPLAPVWAHLAPPCFTRVLLTYSSPLGFEKFSLFRHSWDHFSSRRTSDSHPGYCRVQDHQEIQEMPPSVVPGEGRGGTNMHTCVSLASAAIDQEEDKSESWRQHWHWTIIIITKSMSWWYLWTLLSITNNMHLSIVTNVKADSPQSYRITPGKVVDRKNTQKMRKIVVEIVHSSGWNWDGVSLKTRLSFYVSTYFVQDLRINAERIIVVQYKGPCAKGVWVS